VLTPLNWVLTQDARYLGDYEALVAEVRRQDAGLMTIKTVSRRNWPDGTEPSHATWYEPFADQERIDAAVAWVLSHDEVTGIPTPGDVRLLSMVVDAERRAAGMSRDEAAAVLERVPAHSSPFISIPI
jgi:hypothetical protein